MATSTEKSSTSSIKRLVRTAEYPIWRLTPECRASLKLGNACLVSCWPTTRPQMPYAFGLSGLEALDHWIRSWELGTRSKSYPNFSIRHHPSDFILHVSQRNIMVFPIVGIHAVGSNDNFPVSLVSINCSHPNASVRVDSSENERVGIQFAKNLVQVCFKKGAILLLVNNRKEEGTYQMEEIRPTSVPLIVIWIPLRFMSRKASWR